MNIADLLKKCYIIMKLECVNQSLFSYSDFRPFILIHCNRSVLESVCRFFGQRMICAAGHCSKNTFKRAGGAVELCCFY
jgi:hypothetical protein